ncbi:MAG: ribonuclease HII, partial [Pseudomonadota bacterium]
MTVDFTRETALLKAGRTKIAGVDEVGRGPWAGPVVVAGVILDPAQIPKGLTDSKKISAAKREALAEEIHATARVEIIEISVEEIDHLNILAATMLGMRRAIAALMPDYALIDGNRLPTDLSCPAEAIVKGDGKSASIAAASIVAKVYRDHLMADLARDFPGYGWETNAGYGTKMHQSGLQNLGVTPHH